MNGKEITAMSREDFEAAAVELEKQITQQREGIALFEKQAVDLEPLATGEATTQRPSRRMRRQAMTRRQRTASGASRELRLAREWMKRNGHAPLMLTVRSRNGS